jgi:hypothetical protein
MTNLNEVMVYLNLSYMVLAIPYNIPPAFYMKFKYMFLCLIIPGLDHPRSCINVMLKPLIEELKRMTMTRSKNLTFELCICGRFMILGRTIFF